ncbi:MAG TPA: hypothetical protein VJH92_06310 [Candidatus Nanoarchaeia archaeon]|nr:hypothetical protein [Candidatus Nanoarchaeia archaeon]
MDFDVNYFVNNLGIPRETAIGALTLLFIMLLGLYAYVCFAWMSIFKKMKVAKPWLAFVPFVNVAIWYQISGLNWKWIFLMLLPFFLEPIKGIYIGTIPWILLLAKSHIVVFQKLKYSKWLVLSVAVWFIPYLKYLGYLSYLVIIAIVAWKK